MSLVRHTDLDQLLLARVQERCSASLKKTADKWINKEVGNLLDLIEYAVSTELVQSSKNGIAVGHYGHSIMTGTYFYFDKTKEEVEAIIRAAIPAKPKGFATGSAVDKMVALRIVRLERIVKGMNEQDRSYQRYGNGHKALPAPLATTKFKTHKEMIDFMDSLNSNHPQLIQWQHRKWADELMTEFAKHPNVTDENMEKGYELSSITIVQEDL
jgi:hypothetical protein